MRGEIRSRTVDSLICHLSRRPCGVAASPKRSLDTLMISLEEALRPLRGPAPPDSRSLDKKHPVTENSVTQHLRPCHRAPLEPLGMANIIRHQWDGIDLAGFPQSGHKLLETVWRFTDSDWTLIL